MPERKADRHPTIQNGFHISVDERQRGRFPHQRPVAVVLNDAHAGYQVYQKDIPDHLSSATYHSKSVHWMNNFGLKHANKKEYAGDVPEYSILLEQIEEGEYRLLRWKRDPAPDHRPVRGRSAHGAGRLNFG